MKKLFILILCFISFLANAQTRLIPQFQRVQDYTQTQEDAFAATLSGTSYGGAILYNTTLNKIRIWTGTSFTTYEPDDFLNPAKTVLIATTATNGNNNFMKLTSDGKYPALNGSLITNLAETDPIFSAWNKTTGISITKSQVSDFPTIPVAQIQSDWTQATTSSLDYIKNKPTIPTDMSSKKYIIQTADAALPNAQATGALSTGVLYNTTSTGVLSISKLNLTQPATGSTLTIADGKTLTCNNTIIIAGTDATTITLPSTTGTVALNNQAMFIGTTSVAINRTSASLTLAGITLTTPNIGAATGTSTVLTGSITSSGVTGIGYATGAGGTVTQLTSKSTAFTLSKVCGTIITPADALASQTSVSSTWTNTSIAANDMVIVTHSSGGTIGAYTFNVTPGAGTATLIIRNVTGGSLSEALTLRFVIIKAVIAGRLKEYKTNKI